MKYDLKAMDASFNEALAMENVTPGDHIFVSDIVLDHWNQRQWRSLVNCWAAVYLVIAVAISGAFMVLR